MKRIYQNRCVVFLKNEKIERLCSINSCLLGDLKKNKQQSSPKILYRGWLALVAIIRR